MECSFSVAVAYIPTENNHTLRQPHSIVFRHSSCRKSCQTSVFVFLFARPLPRSSGHPKLKNGVPSAPTQGRVYGWQGLARHRDEENLWSLWFDLTLGCYCCYSQLAHLWNCFIAYSTRQSKPSLAIVFHLPDSSASKCTVVRSQMSITWPWHGIQ